MNHNSYCNSGKTSFLFGQMPNRKGMKNDSPTGKSPTAMPAQGVILMTPKGSMPHRSHAQKGKPADGAKGGSGPTTITRSGGGLSTPSYDTKSKNTAFLNKTYAFEKA